MNQEKQKALNSPSESQMLEKLERAEESLEVLERAGLNSIVVDSPTGHHYYTLVGSHQPYGILIDSVNEAAACLTLDGTILYCNHPFSSILNSMPEALIGKRFVDHLIPKNRKTVDDTLKSGRQGKMEVHVLGRAGDTIHVYLCFSSVTINGQNRVYVLLTDVSEKEQYLEELLEKNRSLEQTIEARDSFLAAMSHNLRTPLNSIIGFADILLAKIPGPLNAVQEEQLGIIVRCSKQLLTLIRQLLDVGLIQHHKLEPVFSACDVNEIIRDIIQELQPLADQKKLKLKSKLTHNQLILNTDRKFFRQIIVNLIDNAIKYTKNGSVTISENFIENSSTDYIEISVVDTGCGIKEENLSDIFQLYSTVHKKQDPYGEHTGLGLVLCCKYCEVLGMKLTCDSEYGKGTRFTITVPTRLKA